jgi:hypothetical protein
MLSPATQTSVAHFPLAFGTEGLRAGALLLVTHWRDKQEGPPREALSFCFDNPRSRRTELPTIPRLDPGPRLLGRQELPGTWRA